MGNQLQTQGNGNSVTQVQASQPTSQAVYYTPRVDIVEHDEELLLFADLPGVKPEDVNLQFENGELSIHGRCERRAYQGTWVLSEYGVGDFYRTFTIGEEIDADRITAELKNGVLTVHLPKSEAVKPRRIAVKAQQG